MVLDRSPESIERFFGRHVDRGLNEADRITLLKLMELQRHSMLMYTSCGWFFDELSGIETVQVLQYAGRAVQLGEELFGGNIESQFFERLEAARSNIAEHRDGRHIYEKWVKPAALDLTRVAAHYAISSVFEEYPRRKLGVLLSCRSRRLPGFSGRKGQACCGPRRIHIEGYTRIPYDGIWCFVHGRP